MKMNILIVEDDPMVAHIHKHYLDELKNFEIIKIIDNGLDAFEFIKLNEDKIDLVILDVHMPKLSGLEMLKLLREEGCNVSVIPITAINDNKTISEFLNLGIVDYLVKPFTQERFNQAVLKCELKYKMFESNNELSQKQLDQMLNITTNSELPKGLQEKTLSHIVQSLKAFKNQVVDVETISDATNLSKVSLRKYLDYLAENSAIEKRIDYGTVGRPKYKYLVK
ncbi:MAG: response regulator [Candidatus Izemoplasma sp.]|nr:response regulator [Candidatus Izemoplasma sp.]